MPQLNGQDVGGTGYGLMGLTWRPQPQPQAESFKTMKTALDQGSNFWNGGELYGPPNANSLHLLNAYFTKYPEDAEKVVLSIKGGLKKGELAVDGSPENVRRSIDECLNVLDGKKKLDLFESARVDPNTPVEITVGAIAEYVKAGKLGGISLSECSANTIRRAATVHKISAVEVEFSLWATDILTNGVAQACADLDIPIVAYSPLGRGFLTGQIKSPDDIPENDMRRHSPRFQADVFYKNLELVHRLEKLAERKKCTPGQIGIAWVKAQAGKPGLPKVIIPIPGATTSARVEENMVDVELSTEDLEEIDGMLKECVIQGDRYGGVQNKLEFGDSPPLEQ